MPTSVPTTVTTNAVQQMFDAKTDASWRAADGSITVGLPSGKVVWLFGDTWRVGQAGLHNTILVQEGNTLTVPDTSDDAIPRPGDSTLFWPSEAVWDGRQLKVFATHLHVIEGGWEDRGMDIATFGLDTRGYPYYIGQRTMSTDDSNGIKWGQAAARSESGYYLYIYGTGPFHDGEFGLDVYLARVPMTLIDEKSKWRYWTGGGGISNTAWSRNETDAVPIEQGATARFGSAFSVDYIGRKGKRYTAVSKEAGTFGTRIIIMHASRPQGPFAIHDAITLYNSTEQYAYCARGHPEIPMADNKFLVTWTWGTDNSDWVLNNIWFPKPQCDAWSGLLNVRVGLIPRPDAYETDTPQPVTHNP